MTVKIIAAKLTSTLSNSLGSSAEGCFPPLGAPSDGEAATAPRPPQESPTGWGGLAPASPPRTGRAAPWSVVPTSSRRQGLHGVPDPPPPHGLPAREPPEATLEGRINLAAMKVKTERPATCVVYAASPPNPRAARIPLGGAPMEKHITDGAFRALLPSLT